MTGVTNKELDDYFKEARRFDQDRVLSAIRSRRVAWTIAIAAMSTTGLAMLAIAGLTPFKTVVPYVIRVDNSTGIVEVMNGLSDGRESYEDAVTKWYAARYVSAREGFVLSEAQENFKTVSLMSQADEQQRFSVAYSGRNPESPQADMIEVRWHVSNVP